MFKSLKKFFSKKEDETQSEEVEVVEPSEEDEKEYRRDNEIELTNEDVMPMVSILGQNKAITGRIGSLRLQYLAKESALQEQISTNNARIDELLNDLRTTYDVDPDIDYEVILPEEEGALPYFKKL